MPLRPARCYRRLKRPYTRTEYIAGAPYVQIPRFELGNTKPRERARFDYVVELVAEETGQIRLMPSRLLGKWRISTCLSTLMTPTST